MSSYIYIGVWTDWSYGSVIGARLTLSNRNAYFLVSFVTLFVRYSGQALWTILCYCAFQARSTERPQNTLYHQLQAALRNSNGDTTFFLEVVKLGFRRRKRAKNHCRRTLGLGATALFHILAFAAAGIFVSKVAIDNSGVLIRSDVCGNWNYPFLVDANSSGLSWQDYNAERVSYWDNMQSNSLRSSNYVASCYNFTTTFSPVASCLPYGRRKIDWSTRMNATCPFASKMCLNNTVVQFDSGFINSNTHLGINSYSEMVEYRRVMTCAPITTDGFVSNWINGTSLVVAPGWGGVFEGEKFLAFHYGMDIEEFNDSTTFAFSDYAFDPPRGDNPAISPYSLDCEFSLALNPLYTIAASTFNPIAQLNLTNADVFLTFLAHNATYTTPVNDPWFLATKPQNLSIYEEPDSVIYYPNQLVTVAGCTEQHQVRNPKTEQTSELGGAEILTRDLTELVGFDQNQIAVFNRSFLAATGYIVPLLVSNLGPSNMLAQSFNSISAVSAPLPDDQWVQEFSHWFGTALVALQFQSLQYVIGQSQEKFNLYPAPVAEGNRWMCDSQIIVRNDYTSFSILGISIVVGVGGLVIILSLVLPALVRRMQKNTLRGKFRNAEWRADHFYELQRMAYERNGDGIWEGRDTKFTIPFGEIR